MFQPNQCKSCTGIGDPTNPDKYDEDADGVQIGANGRCMRYGSKSAMLGCGKLGGLGKTGPCPIRETKKGEPCVKKRLKDKRCYKIGGEKALQMCGVRGMNLRQINDFRFGHRFAMSPRSRISPIRGVPPKPVLKRKPSKEYTKGFYTWDGDEPAYGPYVSYGLPSDFPSMATTVGNIFKARDAAAARTRVTTVRRRRIPRKKR